jgi:hypothetical protein
LPAAATLEALVTDFWTGTIYCLGRGSVPVTAPGEVVSTLLEVDAASGALNGIVIPLDREVRLKFFYSKLGIFSGYSHVYLHDGESVIDIEIPTGQTGSLGALGPLPYRDTDSWAYWGVAESQRIEQGPFFKDVWLLTVPTALTIARYGTPLVTLDNLPTQAGLRGFTFAPALGRCYFQYDEPGSFRHRPKPRAPDSERRGFSPVQCHGRRHRAADLSMAQGWGPLAVQCSPPRRQRTDAEHCRSATRRRRCL